LSLRNSPIAALEYPAKSLKSFLSQSQRAVFAGLVLAEEHSEEEISAEEAVEGESWAIPAYDMHKVLWGTVIHNGRPGDHK